MFNVNMGKKCIPGIICLENMTLFLLFFLCVIILFLYFQYARSLPAKPATSNYQSNYIISQPTVSDQTKLTASVISLQPIQQSQGQSQSMVAAIIPTSILGLAIRTPSNPMNDPYTPPLKDDSIYFPPNSGDERGIPINMKTRGLNLNYSQVGILTRTNNNTKNNEMILPLMGRKNMTGRDKWQYYTMTNTGNLNTKLPVSSNGKSCTSEYGCVEINNGDIVYVEGYNDTFKATVYENSLFSYIPF